MIALIIVIVILVLILILPVGVDASYLEGGFSLKAKAGPIRVRLLPKKKPKPQKEQKEKPEIAEGHGGKPKLKLTLSDILELAKIALKALSRFRRALSIDKFLLHIVFAADDPYSAVMQYGYLNAGLSALAPLLHRAVKIRDEDVQTAVDFEPGGPVIELRVVATLQIWEILYIGLCAGFAFLRWYLRSKKKAKTEAAAGPVEQKD